MVWDRITLKEQAKLSFKRNYGACLVVSIIIGIFAGGTSGFSSGFSSGSSTDVSDFSNIDPSVIMSAGVIILVAGLISAALKVFLGNPFLVGGYKFFIDNFDRNEDMGHVVSVFKSGKYSNVVLVMFLKDLFVSLWSLLFVIPGIIKAYEYRMVPYLLGEYPDMTWEEAKNRSKQMMDGNKWDAFVLDLSFIGWWLLTLVTCGFLAILYVAPYVYATDANLYRVLSGKQAPIDILQPGYPNMAGMNYQGPNPYQQPYQGPNPYQQPYQGPNPYQQPYQGTYQGPNPYQQPYQGPNDYQQPYQDSNNYHTPYQGADQTQYDPVTGEAVDDNINQDSDKEKSIFS